MTNSIWSAIIGLIVIPFHLKYLGVEAYGLIGIFVTMQAVLQILDMGIAPTINREVARSAAKENLDDARKLLHSFAVLYWIIAVLIAILAVTLAPTIADFWIESKQLNQSTIYHAVMLMGLVIACRWPIGLYQGAIIGAQRLAVSSVINIAMVTLGSLGSVGILAFISPTIEAFFIWQILIGIVYASIMHYSAWKIIGKIKKNNFDINSLKKISHFTAGMGAITLAGIVLSQLDKVILSRTLNLEAFGKYMLATVVVSGMYIISSSVFNIIYPRFSTLVAANNTESLIELYRLGTRLLAAVIFPIAMFLVIFGESLLFIWTGDKSIASSAGYW